MNLTDVVAELDSRAREARTTPAEVRLAGIRRRRRARRARAVAGVVVAGVVAGVLGLALLPGADRDRAVQPAWRVRFAPELDGNRLVASGQGRERELVVRFTPRDTDLGITGYCIAGAGTSLRTMLSINGRPLRSSYCTPDGKPGETISSASEASTAATRGAWTTRFGVVPGRESVLRVVATGHGRLDELGVAIYEYGGRRVTSDGVTLRQQIGFAGRRYRLAEYRTLPVTADARELSVRGSGPGVVSAGLLGTATSPTVDVRVNGEEAVHGGDGYTTGQTTSRAPTTTVRVTGDPVGGALFVAYYVPE